MPHNKLETVCANAAIAHDPGYNAVVPPLYLTTNYAFSAYDEMGLYDYTRSGNPNCTAFGDAVAKLEGGAGAAITASGMAAIDLLLNLLPSGAHILAPHDAYGGTHRLLNARAEQGRCTVTYIDQTDLPACESAMRARCDLVIIETPSNPLMRLTDIAAMCVMAKKAGAKTMVDNTFLSPARQSPLSLGADFALHSATKYLNGHSDAMGGALVAKCAEDTEKLFWWANCTGVTGGAFDSYMMLRGLRTLSVRMAQQEANARRLSSYLATHPLITAVHYPGLSTHPQFELAERQQSGPGAMLSFELEGGAPAVRQFLKSLDLFTLAESLGGTESLISHPATMTHRAMSAQARARAGICDGLLRISTGLEDANDLLAALARALDFDTARRKSPQKSPRRAKWSN